MLLLLLAAQRRWLMCPRTGRSHPLSCWLDHAVTVMLCAAEQQGAEVPLLPLLPLLSSAEHVPALLAPTVPGIR